MRLIALFVDRMPDGGTQVRMDAPTEMPVEVSVQALGMMAAAIAASMDALRADLHDRGLAYLIPEIDALFAESQKPCEGQRTVARSNVTVTPTPTPAGGGLPGISGEE